MKNFFLYTYKSKYGYKNLSKKNKIFIIILAIIAAIILITAYLLPNSYKNKFATLFSYSVQQIPKNLDPQTASNSDEISVINNIFEGLYKRNLDNTFSLACANSVRTNPEKTIYNFTIKDDLYWVTNCRQKQPLNNKLTASDFEFAFKRLLNPQTKSPFALNYYFIKNAQKVHSGQTNLNQLGVYTNGNQLTIELEHPVPNLEELLSLSPTMPCNEKFFNSTNGRYGLCLETLLCNGPFYVHQWPQNQKNKRLRIRVNSKNPSSKNIKIMGVNLSQRPSQETFRLLKKNEIDSAILNTSEFNLNKSKIGLNQVHQFNNSTSGIVFNQNNELFQNEKIRQALAMSIDRKSITKKLNSKKAKPAFNLVPDSVTIAGKPFNDIKKTNACPEYDPETAKNLFNQGINELKQAKNKIASSKNNKRKTEEQVELNKFSIMITNDLYEIINEILQNWQKNLNIYLKIDLCDDETFLKNLKNKNFDCALINIENDFNNPCNILSQFLKNSPLNFANFDLPKLEPLINQAVAATSADEMTKLSLEAEREILNSGSFIPIFHPIQAFVCNQKFKDVLLIENCKQLLFSFIKPKK